MYFFFFIYSAFEILVIGYLIVLLIQNPIKHGQGHEFDGLGVFLASMVIAILAVYFLQGLTWTIYTSKLAAVYHSELGHDVYSSGSHHVEPAHHHDVHNQQYVQV